MGNLDWEDFFEQWRIYLYIFFLAHIYKKLKTQIILFRNKSNFKLVPSNNKWKGTGFEKTQIFKADMLWQNKKLSLVKVEVINSKYAK